MERECSDLACPEWKKIDWSVRLCSKCGGNSLFAFPRDMADKKLMQYDYRTYFYSMDVHVDPDATAFCYTTINVPITLGKYLHAADELPNECVFMEEYGDSELCLHWYEEDGRIIFVYQVHLDEQLSQEEKKVFLDPKFPEKALSIVKNWLKHAELFPIPNYVQKEFRKGYKVFANWLVKNVNACRV